MRFGRQAERLQARCLRCPENVSDVSRTICLRCPESEQSGVQPSVERFLSASSDRERRWPAGRSSHSHLLSSRPHRPRRRCSLSRTPYPGADAGGPRADPRRAPSQCRSRVHARELCAGDTAKLVISNRAQGLRLQIFHSGPERLVTRSNSSMNGVPVTPKVPIGSSGGRRVVDVKIGRWQAGSISTPPRRRRPRRVRTVRRAATPSRQAPRRRGPADADVAGLQPPGRGRRRHRGLWYADWKTKTVRLGRPYRAAASRTTSVATTCRSCTGSRGREGGRMFSRSPTWSRQRAPRALAAAYDLMVFPGHQRRDDARIRPDRGLPEPRRQSHVPLGEQLLLARREAWQHHEEDEALARSAGQRRP